MLNRALTLAAFLGVAIATASAAAKDIHRTLPLDPRGHVTIDTYKGSIRVSTWDRSEIDVLVRIEEDLGVFPQSVDRADVRFDASPSDVRMTSEQQWNFFLDGSAPLYHYTIRMPRTASLRIKDYKSASDISDLSADLDVNTYKGSLELRNYSGALTATTYKGEIRAEFAAFNARSRIDTYKGSVDLQLPRDSRFDLATGFNRKAELDSDFTAYVRSRSGNSRAAVNGGGPELRLKSYKGDFRLRAR